MTRRLSNAEESQCRRLPDEEDGQQRSVIPGEAFLDKECHTEEVEVGN
jgi:hypothetical protein